MATGKVVQTETLTDTFGQRNWQPISKTIEVPKGAKSARFQARINKASGQFWVDELSASYLAAAPKKDNRIERLVLSTAQWGNMLLPTDARKVQVSLQAIKPIRDNQRTISYVVRDYWGAEQTKAAQITLENKGKKGDRFVYEGEIDLSNAPLEIGRYYEVHAHGAARRRRAVSQLHLAGDFARSDHQAIQAGRDSLHQSQLGQSARRRTFI